MACNPRLLLPHPQPVRLVVHHPAHLCFLALAWPAKLRKRLKLTGKHIRSRWSNVLQSFVRLRRPSLQQPVQSPAGGLLAVLPPRDAAILADGAGRHDPDDPQPPPPLPQHRHRLANLVGNLPGHNCTNREGQFDAQVGENCQAVNIGAGRQPECIFFVLLL